MAKRTYKGRTEAYDQAALPAGAGNEFDAQERTIAGAVSPKIWATNPAAAGEGGQAAAANKECLTPGQVAGTERPISGSALMAIETMAD